MDPDEVSMDPDEEPEREMRLQTDRKVHRYRY